MPHRATDLGRDRLRGVARGMVIAMAAGISAPALAVSPGATAPANSPASLFADTLITLRPPSDSDQRRALPPVSLGALPASWQGDLPGAGGPIRWHLDLASDGTFQLRQTFLSRPKPNAFDAIGRWQLESGSGRLVLNRGSEAPLFLQPLAAGAALGKLDLQGAPVASAANDRLTRLPQAAPIDPRLPLTGLFSYMADAASIRLCATGQRLPVAMEAGYLALERAYLAARPADRPGQPLLVSLEGLITQRPSMEQGQPPRRTLVVESFTALTPGQGCPREPLPLRGTTWRLEGLGGQQVATPPGGRPMELQLSPERLQLAGSGGCNRLMGGFSLQGASIRFSQLASTRMGCSPPVMELEQRYSNALEQVRRWRIDQRHLLLQDASGKTLLRFRASQ
ncbi:META domain-containing protein [Synechococcus sp. ATX 2A4]|uniref:META domain-containing protein n=1 Tax=Synechococcus sp. ATX 2A4 TaxID=2823727 RepID=UPI0020CF310B|nr:META domain-containing protein [Synechococcus sp. ATX 2A4]MCP9885619.1 META domain-containing protein [Synechococcus sp. ATX 2A4]